MTKCSNRHLFAAIVVWAVSVPTLGSAQSVPYTITFNTDFTHLHNSVERIRFYCEMRFFEGERFNGTTAAVFRNQLTVEVPASGVISGERQITVEVPLLSAPGNLYDVSCNYRITGTDPVVAGGVLSLWPNQGNVRGLRDWNRSVGPCVSSTQLIVWPEVGTVTDRPCQ